MKSEKLSALFLNHCYHKNIPANEIFRAFQSGLITLGRLTEMTQDEWDYHLLALQECYLYDIPEDHVEFFNLSKEYFKEVPKENQDEVH